MTAKPITDQIPADIAEHWVADRTKLFDSSGIRRVFDLGKQLKNPVNLSIGQPDFDVPQPVKRSLIQAIEDGKNGYALTQGIPPLQQKLQSMVDEKFGHRDRKVFVCSGTSGGLVLTFMSVLNDGDEVIFFDPFFVMYESLIQLLGGVPVPIANYPDFQIDLETVKAHVTDRTRMILVNSPSNPTGCCIDPAELKAIASFAAERGICLVSDEIYSKFVYDQPHATPASWNENTIVIDGFSKSYAMTGHRVGYVHGPTVLIDTMIKLQQYTFVCAPHPAQWAAIEAIDFDVTPLVDEYRGKRDRMIDGLKDDYEITKPGGAFYMFPRLPEGMSGDAFFQRAVDNNLLIIPGNIFSRHDTHFRISYAASDANLDRGIEILKRISRP